MNHTCPLPSQPKLVLIYRPRRDGRLSWPWVAGWLHTVLRSLFPSIRLDLLLYYYTSCHRLLTLKTFLQQCPVTWWIFCQVSFRSLRLVKRYRITQNSCYRTTDGRTAGRMDNPKTRCLLLLAEAQKSHKRR